MNGTREDFCRALLDDDPREVLDPETLAARFVRYFGLSTHPTLDELKVLLKEAGFGEVSEWEMDGLKGAHIGRPRGHYDIYYRQGMWDGSSAYTVVHETYEIIYETLCDMESGSPPDRKVCRQAERFAAAVLMQPGMFGPMALKTGLDVLALQRAFRCSYAAVAIRLAEVPHTPSLMAVLYENGEKGDPAGWSDSPDLRAKVVRRTRGFGMAASPLFTGKRGGILRWGRPIAEGSLASQAARYHTPRFHQDDNYAVIARPVIWKGKLAKVAVVAVPLREASVLEPQIMAADGIGRTRKPRPVAAASVGPW